MSHLRTALTGAALAGSLLLATGASASARVVETFPLDFSDSGSTDPGFCDVEGLVVDFTYDQTGIAKIHERGRDGLLYFHGSTSYVQTFTHDGRTVTTVGRTLEKDLTVVDNGDGTIEVLVLLTGPARTLSEEGRILAKNDGQSRILLVIDLETGDLVGEPELVFGSTGTNDDFCAAALDYWGL